MNADRTHRSCRLQAWILFPSVSSDVTESILNVFYGIYNELGYGFLESVYEEAMVIGLTQAGHHVGRQVPLRVWFRGQPVGDFRADLVVDDKIILELKSARALEPSHEAQLLNYLRATEMEVGLLLNFGIRPQFRRLVFENTRKAIRVHPRESAAGVPA